VPETVSCEDVSAISWNADKLMRHIRRRQWWLWSSAMSVLLVMAVGIASFALPTVLSGSASVSEFFLNGAVRGLLGLVLLFNVYVVYEQAQIDRLRREVTENLYSLAVLDPLTGLYNRRFMEHRLEEEILRCRRNSLPLKVILFDLDDFKKV